MEITMKIETKIAEMLKENTGSHFLDSGGAYGRHHERNQTRDFQSEPRQVIDTDYDSLDVSISTYHWLTEHLYISAESEALQAMYNDFVKNSDECYLADMESFVEHIKAGGPYWSDEPCTFNTYNGECLLDQTLQGVIFEYDGTEYILLQIHGGCDVRGGYTAPYIFELESDCFMLYNDTDIHFTDGTYIRTDDGYHWYNDACNEVVIDIPEEKKDSKDRVLLIIDGETKTIGETCELVKNQLKLNL